MNAPRNIALALILTASLAATAQSDTKPDTKPEPRQDSYPPKTFYLANSLHGNSSQNSSEILVAMRNMLDPHVKIYLVDSQNAIVVEASPDQLKLVEKLLADLDRPKKTYRLTYTLTDFDNGKRVGTQHLSMIVIAGDKTSLKQGSKIPVLTGSYNPGPATSNSGVQTQYTYLDIGMNFSATLDDFTNGVRLQSKIEESSVAENRSGLVEQDPVVRQTVLEGTSFLTLGKPLILGSLDITGTTRHLDIEVVMELVQ